VELHFSSEQPFFLAFQVVEKSEALHPLNQVNNPESSE
jgi:hypothetical protein